jgi:Na+/phosphate symporter
MKSSTHTYRLIQRSKNIKKISDFTTSIWYYTCVQDLLNTNKTWTEEEIREKEKLYEVLLNIISKTFVTYEA